MLVLFVLTLVRIAHGAGLNWIILVAEPRVRPVQSVRVLSIASLIRLSVNDPQAQGLAALEKKVGSTRSVKIWLLELT